MYSRVKEPEEWSEEDHENYHKYCEKYDTPRKSRSEGREEYE